MHAISSYRSNRATNTQTNPQTNKQTNPQIGPITIHCADELSAQCNENMCHFWESKHTVTLPTYFRGSGSLNPQDLRRWCVQARTWVNYAAREMNGRRFFSDCCSRLRFFDEKVRHALRLGDGIRALASSGGGGGAVTSSRTVGRRRPRRSVALRNRRLENEHQHTHTNARAHTYAVSTAIFSRRTCSAVYAKSSSG